MWSLILKAIRQWWLHSSLSKWYVKKITRRYGIDLSQFLFAANAVPTLAQFMLRKYRTKPPIPRSDERFILSPLSGSIGKHDLYCLTLHIHSHDYHRIHLPIAGSVTHYTRAPYTSTTIHVTAPDGLIVSLTIATPSEQHATILRYNPQRNYHLQGTEIGYIHAAEATMTLQSNRPCLYVFAPNQNLTCLSLLGETPPLLQLLPTREKVL